MPQLKDPRGRPYKIFTVIVEQFDELHLMTVRAHDPDHAKKLAHYQVRREAKGLPTIAWFAIKMVLAGTARRAT